MTSCRSINLPAVSAEVDLFRYANQRLAVCPLEISRQFSKSAIDRVSLSRRNTTSTGQVLEQWFTQVRAESHTSNGFTAPDTSESSLM